MTGRDVGLGMRLKEQAGWNQTEADWRRLMDLQPDGCFVAELAGRPAGTAAVCVFDSVAWIMMLLVDQAVRGRGIGTRLVRHCLANLERRRVATTRLDATPLGRPIYEKLGFRAEYELVRFQGTARGGACRAGVEPAGADHLDGLIGLDRQVTGTDRRRLIERLYHERPDAMLVFSTGGEIAGYLTWRDGSRARQIGPAVARSAEAGRALCDAALQRCAGQPVFIDVPADNRPAVRWAESKGLVVQRPFIRMHRGRPVDDRPAHLWASFGPEKG